MQSSIIKFGGFSLLILIGIPVLSSLFIESGPEDFTLGEIVGYSAIILSLLLIVFAQNDYRKQLTEPMKYRQGFLIGLAISTIGGIAFGLYNLIYIAWINPEFMDQYYGYYIESIKASDRTAEEIQATIEKLNSEKAMWMSPVVQFFGMFLTVFPMGMIITLFSSAIISKYSQKQFKQSITAN